MEGKDIPQHTKTAEAVEQQQALEQPLAQEQPAARAVQGVDDQKEHRGWRLSRAGTILLTTAALVLTGTPRTEQVTIGHEPDDEPDVARTSTTSQQGHEQVTHAEQVDVAAEVWAQLFSDDEHAGELTGMEQLTSVRKEIQSILAQGNSITKVTLEGHASAEDDSVDANGQRTGGLTEPSSENTLLANKRARTFKPMLEKELAAHDVDGVPELEIVAPVEGVLSDQEVKHINELAKQFGYSEVVTLIEQYNRNEGVPPAAQEYLDQVLARDRKVTVTIDYQQAEQSPRAQPSSEDDESGLPKSITITLPLFVFIPWFRRNKRTEPEPAPQQVVAGGGEPVTRAQKAKRPKRSPSFVPHRRDAAFRERGLAMAGAPGYRSTWLQRKQPRDFSAHGTRGRNHHIARDRGGSR